ncbi:hypothetical protein Maqu_3271 [Marinobacter nauticus VT8]|uniref:DUF3135 domain-containing protein n=2 Tax=Marinobacter nauticus TaxID=2743 RepID=A1U5S3_MARN8|nr:hypothetical protein Maqu_3271 [Marinobacter nauticus VT8]
MVSMSKADPGREQESELPTFDDFVALLASDPEGFEALRTTLIENEIANAPLKDQRRLRGIQFQVDCARRASKNPIASCVKIQKMLYESAEELKSLVQYHCAPTDSPTNQMDFGVKALTPPQTSNNILQFQRPKHCPDE